ncbi:MAG: thrombospondin type 3 repeat-containing protein [Nitrospinae bacterium]|nr:thrombospondin type 3 repeat-containing protein [Nitrospinota bacterium]
MWLKTMALSLALASGLVITANAQGSQKNSISSVTGAYRFYKDIDNVPINVPTVIEVPFTADFIERLDFAVLDKTANSFEPQFFKQDTLVHEIPVSINTIQSVDIIQDTDNADKMIDKDTGTYADFLLPENTRGQVQIILSSINPITSSILTVLLDSNVALPTSMEIRALVDGQNRIVVANRRMDQQTIRFPQTASSRWTFTFTFGQSLRISELRLNQDNAAKSSSRAIRFLAQPGHSYRIYFDPDRSAKAPVGEEGNLISAQNVLAVPEVSSQNNPDYIIADMDNDGVPDIRDNCISVSNADQQDINDNGRGDVCDDFDQDGLINSKDNCPDSPNRDQRDTDGDGVGDVCDKEENRLTERYPWIPWVGIGFAALVLIILLILTVRATYAAKQGDDQ